MVPASAERTYVQLRKHGARSRKHHHRLGVVGDTRHCLPQCRRRPWVDGGAGLTRNDSSEQSHERTGERLRERVCGIKLGGDGCLQGSGRHSPQEGFGCHYRPIEPTFAGAPHPLRFLFHCDGLGPLRE